MIEFLSWVASSIGGLMDLWSNVVAPITNPDWVIGALIVFFIAALFWIIRLEVKYCSKVWIGDGVLELMIAMVLSVAATALIYCLPLVILAGCFAYLAGAFLAMITFLAKISVPKPEVKNG